MNYRIRFHPLVARDLDTIARWIIDHADVEVVHRKLNEIELPRDNQDENAATIKMRKPRRLAAL